MNCFIKKNKKEMHVVRSIIGIQNSEKSKQLQLSLGVRILRSISMSKIDGNRPYD